MLTTSLVGCYYFMPYYDFRLEVKLHQAAAIIADDVFVNALINSKCSHTNGNIAQPLCNKLQFKEGISQFWKKVERFHCSYG